ncbi:MAG: methionine adenosyltransferase [Candidatus Sungbacteria bacterium]|nr:methionine adenosyltransferase [Candidatus Sungbacteria bacterium]
MQQSRTYTVESVTSGHPDKICDQISDAILDECLRQDSKSRVAIEVFGGHGLLLIGGELTTRAQVDFVPLARRIYRDIGHTDELEIITRVVQQSPDIAQGVDTGGAGAWLHPDGKAQVTIQNGALRAVLVSCQHDENITQQEIRTTLIDKLIVPLIGDISSVEVLVNPTGKFVQGGFEADTGLTGRKIMVDTYGGLIPHGGGAFSGKDATKVDRSAAYMARFAAKNIVVKGLANTCLVSVAYAIGRAEPLMVEAVNEKGESLADIVQQKFDFRPSAIIDRLGLRRPIYQQTAAYGHFGKPGLPWEEIIS